MTETLTHGYSSDSVLPKLSNEYQQDRVKKIFKNIHIIVFWTKVALALEQFIVLSGKNFNLNFILPGQPFSIAKYNLNSGENT